MLRVTTIFTVECVAHHGIREVFNDVSSRRATRAVLLLQVKLEGFRKRGSEPIEGVPSCIGKPVGGPILHQNGVSEAS